MSNTQNTIYTYDWILQDQIPLQHSHKHLISKLNIPITTIHMNQQVLHWQHSINSILNNLPVTLMSRFNTIHVWNWINLREDLSFHRFHGHVRWWIESEVLVWEQPQEEEKCGQREICFRGGVGENERSEKWERAKARE